MSMNTLFNTIITAINEAEQTRMRSHAGISAVMQDSRLSGSYREELAEKLRADASAKLNELRATIESAVPALSEMIEQAAPRLNLADPAFAGAVALANACVGESMGVAAQLAIAEPFFLNSEALRVLGPLFAKAGMRTAESAAKDALKKLEYADRFLTELQEAVASESFADSAFSNALILSRARAFAEAHGLTMPEASEATLEMRMRSALGLI